MYFDRTFFTVYSTNEFISVLIGGYSKNPKG